MSSQFSATIFNDGHPIWPNDPPKDLELRLLDALSYRSCNQAALWDEIKDWLEENRIEPTAMVDQQRSIASPRPRGCTKYS